MRGSERRARTSIGRSSATVTRTSRTAALLVAALVVAACGDDEATTDGDTGDQDAAEETAAVDEDGTGSDDPADGDPAEEEPATDDSATSDSPIDTTLTGADGWSDLLDLDIPDPETAVLEFAGERYTFDVRCSGTGEVPDGLMVGNEPMIDTRLFDFGMLGNGTSDGGHTIQISAGRTIYVDGDRLLNMRNAGWGGEGQFDQIVFSGLVRTSSLIHQSPSGEDPDGDQLPVVRVSRDGIVTAEGELVREFADETELPEGPYTFAGRCQEAWPQDEIDAATG